MPKNTGTSDLETHYEKFRSATALAATARKEMGGRLLMVLVCLGVLAGGIVLLPGLSSAVNVTAGEGAGAGGLVAGAVRPMVGLVLVVGVATLAYVVLSPWIYTEIAQRHRRAIPDEHFEAIARKFAGRTTR